MFDEFPEQLRKMIENLLNDGFPGIMVIDISIPITPRPEIDDEPEFVDVCRPVIPYDEEEDNDV